MLPKVGTYTFRIESYVCDFRGKATLPTIGNFILQAATMHAQERGFGYEDVSKDAVAWVLSRLSIDIYEYPNHNETFIVETWIEDVMKFFTQRCFKFKNSDGKTIGYARSIWAGINTTTRRPVDLSVWRADMFDYTDNTIECPVEKSTKIPAADGEPIMGYTVRYSDIDINNHMNSIKYIEHTTDIFDLDFFKNNNIRKFEIAYMAEGSFGDKLKLYKNEISPNECVIDTKKGDESICRSRIAF
jgi:acyl-ACP thioesterase